MDLDFDHAHPLDLTKEKRFVGIPHRIVISVAAMMPIGGILLCLYFAITYHHANTTSTHCNVYNWLPSFSAAIGNNYPETTIWRTAIAFMIAQRLVDAAIYHNFHQRTGPVGPYRSLATGSIARPSWTLYSFLNACHSLCLILENFSLMLLTYVSSTEDFGRHEMGFVFFIVFANLNMALNLLLFHYKPMHQRTKYRRSITLKQLFFALQLGLLASAAYLYLRHNRFCEPGVYSLFALSEYLLVAANIAFHYTIVLDVPGAKLGFTVEG